jgi:hypothetical protein
MTAHSTAQGIASLGRYGDDLIVHMNQEEVQGLQALAKQHGTSLTINPKTGMPEAFKLGGVFKALIPIAAGVMFPGFGASLFGGMQGIGAGILAGAATAALTGGNPLLGGVTGALGGYSGAGLGNSFANLGSTAATTGTNVANVTAQNAATNVVGNTLMGQGATAFTSPFTSMFTPSGIAGGAGLGAGTVANAGIVGQGALSNAANNALTNQAMNASLTGANTAANAGNAINLAGTTQAAAPTYGDKLKSGVEKFFQKETTYTDPVTGKTVTGSGFDAYRASLPTRGGEITGITKDAAGNVISSVETPTKMATNMDVFKKIGMPVGGALLGGVEASDLNPQINLSEQEQKVYEQTGIDSAGKPTFGYIAKSAFNPYRTLNLSGPSPLNLGQSLKLPASTSYATGGTIQSGGIRDLYGTPDNQPTISPGLSGFGLGRLNNLAGEQAMTQAKTLGYADGGDIGGDAVDESAPNPEGIVSKYTTAVDDKGIASRVRVPYQYEKIITPGALDFYDIPPIGYNPDTYAGLLRKQKGMARGGYLNGAGDGMSDSIPATIEGKQPARLADGEFVIPADVVSHLGNGSSKAGSKRLYAMLDKVRHARTGNKKQGKQINPAKYMPA